MHVTSKEVDENGKHILTSVLEADGPFALVSEKGSISASVVSAVRTSSGGVELKVAVSISEPAVEAPKSLSEEDVALEYLASKGIKGDEAKEDLAKFGASRILAQKSGDEAKAQSELDEELKAKLSPGEPA